MTALLARLRRRLVHLTVAWTVIGSAAAWIWSNNYA